MTLHLTLKKKWFDMTKSGEKLEEYREIKPYWVSRLCNLHKGCIGTAIMDRHKVEAHTFKDFNVAVLRNGYSKNAKEIIKEIDFIMINTGREEWGAEKDKLYFVIKYKN